MSTIRISVTGTESTGKTTLAEQLSLHYQCAYVPDVSRDYIAALNRAYTYEDVLQIAREIIIAEDKAVTALNTSPLGRPGGDLLISDNDLINIKIWLQYYKWQVPTWLNNSIVARKYDIYLLCNIDLPWVEDEQRNNPHDRQRLFNLFVHELQAIGSKYYLISGSYEQRLQSAVNQLAL